MNAFGGTWTKEKMEIFMKYVPAYLTIMNIHAAKYDWKLLYFDGFAGSGAILQQEETDELAVMPSIMEGVATQVLKTDSPRSFDYYLFVEKNPANAKQLRQLVDNQFPIKAQHVRVAESDFNTEIIRLAEMLRNEQPKKTKTLAYIDPYGMSVRWESVEALKGLSIDMWILIPTGIGVNRLLTKEFGQNKEWLGKLSDFFGVPSEAIQQRFYKTTSTLFGDELEKERDAVKRAHALYAEKLGTVFKHISAPFVMENSRGSVLYHFLLASNNATAVRIANDIIGKGISKL
jgi:three-Cys-motif partner protein